MTWLGRVLAAAAAAAALHGAVWAYATARLQDEAAAQLDDLRRQGWTVAAGTPRWAGWPLAATLRYQAVVLDGTEAGVPFAWAAGAVDVSLRAAQPGTLLIVPHLDQRLRLGRAGWSPVAAESLEFAIASDAADATGRGLAFTLPDGILGIAAMHAHAAGRELRLDLTGIHAPPFLDAGHATAVAVLTGPLLPGPDPAAAAAWRDSGGSVQIKAVTLSTPEAEASASGAGRLDAGLQPVLDLNATVRGYRAALDRLVQAGAVPASAAVAAKAVLGLLSPRTPDAPAVFRLHLSGGVLSAAGFPLLRTPPLEWLDRR